MPTASAFAAAHLDSPSGELRSDTLRFRAGQPLRHLTRLLSDGNSAANAQAYIAARKDYQRTLARCDARARALGTTTFLSDFVAIDSP